MAAKAVGHTVTRWRAGAIRLASVASTAPPPPPVAELSPITPDVASTEPYQSLSSALFARSIAVAEQAGLLNWTAAEKAQFEKAEEAARRGPAVRDGEDAKGPSKLRNAHGKLQWRRLRFMSPIARRRVVQEEMERLQARRSDRPGIGSSEVEDQAGQSRTGTNVVHPAIRALKLPSEVTEVSLELAAKDAGDLVMNETPWKTFGLTHLPALMWANPSTIFRVEYGRPLHQVVVRSGERTCTLEITASTTAPDLLRRIIDPSAHSNASSWTGDAPSETTAPADAGVLASDAAPSSTTVASANTA